MFKFFKGLKTAIDLKSLAKDQVLFSKDSGRLQFDITENNTTTRYDVKDTEAIKSVTYSNHIFTFKDGAGSTLSTVDISSPTLFWVDTTTGHLMFNLASDIQTVSNVGIPGNLTVIGNITADGIVTVNGTGETEEEEEENEES